MNVAIVGAGALGRVYGTLLALGGHRVDFVVRPSRLEETEPFVLRPGSGDALFRLDAPRRRASLAADTDVVVLTVRVDQLDDALLGVLRAAPPCPVVALTPLLPAAEARLTAVVPGPLRVGLPTVASRTRPDGTLTYWLAPRPTLIEAEPEELPPLTDLAAALSAAGLPTRLEAGVTERAPATTMAFFPFSVALARADGLEALAASEEATQEALAACREMVPLARLIGPVEPGVALLLRLLTPGRLALVVRLARRFAPEPLDFLDEHFGAKLMGQHQALGAEILALAEEHGVPQPKLAALLSGAASGHA